MRDEIDLYTRCDPGKASDFIRHADEEIRPGDKVVLCCRVSGWEQDRRGNLKRSEAYLRQEMAAMGAVVIGVCARVWPGSDPIWLAPAVAVAKKRNAKLVAESVDRFIRSPGYHKTCQQARPRSWDLGWLERETDGLTLATLYHPDLSPGEVRARQTRRGQQVSGRKGGRPSQKRAGWKKRRREELTPRALELRGQGHSIRKIATLLKVRPTTVQGWVNNQQHNKVICRCE